MEKINLITPEDMATFDRIDKDCLAMHVCPPPKTFINMKVHDADGNLTLDMDMPSRSWVRNAYNLLTCYMLGISSNSGGTTFGEGKLPLRDTSGTTLQNNGLFGSVSSDTSYYLGSSISWGILVGSGTTAESFESTTLDTLINTGTGSGRLTYQNQVKPTPTYDSETKKWTVAHERIFNNNSGASISVNETCYVFRLTSNNSVMVTRDLLPSTVTVANAAQLTVTYTIEMTFPA